MGFDIIEINLVFPIDSYAQNDKVFYQEYVENVSDEEETSAYDDENILSIEDGNLECHTASQATDLMANLIHTKQEQNIDDEKLLDL